MLREWFGKGFTEAAESLLAGLLHPVTGCIAIGAMLLGALILSPAGTSFTTCAMKSSTGLPCPGCGLTRSVTSILHGKILAAWQYNPFGFGFLLLFVLASPSAFLPKKYRQRIKERLDPYKRTLLMVFLSFVLLMLTHGVMRSLLVASGASGYAWWRTDEIAPALREQMPAANDPSVSESEKGMDQSS